MNVLRFCEWLQNEGFKTSLWCIAESPLENAAKSSAVTLYRIPRHRKYLDFSAAFRLSRMLEQQTVDIVWIRDTRDISVCGLAKRFSQRRFSLVYQQAMQIGVNKRDIAHTMRFNQIDRWIAPLNYLAEQVRTKTRFPHNRIRVIPLAVDVERYARLPTKSEARAALQIDLPEGALLLGNVGRIDPLKGQDFLLDCFLALRKQGIDIYLLLMGDPTRNEGSDYLEHLQSKAASSSEGERIFFRPHRPDVEVAYAAVDLFAMVSAGETFGMVTIEAMASGCAIIGTNTSGTPELLGEGAHGVLYPPNDERSFIRGIQPLIDDAELRQRTGALAREYAVKTFRKEAVLAQLSTLINTLPQR